MKQRLIQVVVPRSGGDLARTMRAVEALGVEVLGVEVMTSRERGSEGIRELGKVDGVVLTSGMGVGAATRMGWRGDVWCVGEATAEKARAAEMTVVGIGGGDAGTLAVAMREAGVRGRWVHVHGARARRDWYDQVGAGCVVESVVGYEMVPVARMPADVRARLVGSDARVGMGFSVEMLKAWQGMLAREKMSLETRGVAMSAAVKRLGGDGWVVAKTPSLHAMLDELRKMIT